MSNIFTSEYNGLGFLSTLIEDAPYSTVGRRYDHANQSSSRIYEESEGYEEIHRSLESQHFELRSRDSILQDIQESISSLQQNGASALSDGYQSYFLDTIPSNLSSEENYIDDRFLNVGYVDSPSKLPVLYNFASQTVFDNASPSYSYLQKPLPEPITLPLVSAPLSPESRNFKNEEHEKPLDLRGDGLPLPKRSSRLKKIFDAKATSENNSVSEEHEDDVMMKIYDCPHCSSSFSTCSALSTHLMEHPNGSYECKSCTNTFSTKRGFIYHKRNCRGPLPHECEFCSKRFRLNSTLISHRNVHSGKKPFECDTCGEKFNQTSSLRRHRASHQNKRIFKCSRCDQSFNIKGTLQKHLALHDLKDQYKCNICAKSFNNQRRLQIHSMLHNEGELPFKCQKCSSMFRTRKAWTQHRRRIHQKLVELHCSQCEASFKCKFRLNAHMKVHGANSTLQCNYCEALFNHLGTLTKHMRTHISKGHLGSVKMVDASISGDKELNLKQSIGKFRCHTCEQSFVRNRQLQAHEKHCNPLRTDNLEY